MKMILPMRLGIFDPLLQNLLCLLNKLTMQINRVISNAPTGVVLAEDKLRGLLVILFHLATVRFALLRELLRAGAITARVCFLGLRWVGG